MSRKLNILGTEYNLIFLEEPDQYMKENGFDAYIDYFQQNIVILVENKGDDFTRGITQSSIAIKHEIIHTFLHESGLPSNVCSFHTEDCVEYFSRQFAKIAVAIQEGMEELYCEFVEMDHEEAQSDNPRSE